VVTDDVYLSGRAVSPPAQFFDHEMPNADSEAFQERKDKEARTILGLQRVSTRAVTLQSTRHDAETM